MQHNDTIIGTIGGTLLAVVTVNSSTFITTVVVAVIGSTTSFFVSLFLKWAWKKYVKK